MFNLMLRLIIFAIILIADCEGYNGHIRALAAQPIPPYFNFKWDSSSGNMSEASGVLPIFLDLISQRFRLTYSWVPIGKSLLVEDTPNQKGLITHLIEDKGDVAVCAGVPTYGRYEFVDFSVPVVESPFSIIIPMPSSRINNKALFQPFRIEVWMGIVVCLFAIVFFWYLFELIGKCFRNKKGNNSQKGDVYFVPVAYTLTVLLSQGNTFPKRILPIRLIAAAWCLAAFVLVPAYSGTLTSFLTSPVLKPLVDSYEDITNGVPAGLKVAVERDMGIDVQLQSWAKLFARGALNGSTIGKMAFVSSNSTFRCSKLDTCIDKVAEDDYVAVVGALQALTLVSNDWKNNGKCRVTLAKNSFNKAYAVWLLKKRNPYSHKLNQGILEIDAFGLSNHLIDHYKPRSEACLKANHMPPENKKISLLYMSSTFTLFLACCGLSSVMFIGEILFKKCTKTKSNRALRRSTY